MTEKTTWKERRFRKIIASLDGKILNSDDLTGGGEPSVLFCLDNLTEGEALSLLRDKMSAWYYLMMERYGQSTRQELLGEFDSAGEAWEDYVVQHTSSIYYYDKEIELCADCRPRDVLLPQDVYRQIADIQKITPDNALAVADAVRIVEQARKRDVQRRY